jgi:hypothetical protein
MYARKVSDQSGFLKLTWTSMQKKLMMNPACVCKPKRSLTHVMCARKVSKDLDICKVTCAFILVRSLTNVLNAR